MSKFLSLALLLGLLTQTSAFSVPHSNPNLRLAASLKPTHLSNSRLCTSSSSAPSRATRKFPCGLKMQEGEVNMLNLEGHYKPGEGFKPHFWKIDGDYSLTWDENGVAEAEVQLVPVSTTYEDFVAGFTNDSSPRFSVEPMDGCLDCKGGDVETLKVTYTGIMQSPQFATLVVVLPAENHSWTFKFKAAPPSS